MRKTGSLILLLFCIYIAGYSKEPEVSISLSQDSVLIGDSLTLTVTVRNVKNPKTPVIKEVPGFKVRFTGSRKESFSSFSVVIQGKKIEKTTSGGGYYFDFELIPKKTGEIEVESFEIRINNMRFNTIPFKVKVLESSEQSGDIFFNVLVDRNEVYLGEKIVVTFKWYISKNINDYKLNIPWLDTLNNFIIDDPILYSNINYQRLIINSDKQVAAEKNKEVFKGKPYTVFTFRKILSPLSVGTYSLDPVFLKCSVVTGYKQTNRGFFDDFFGSGRQAITENYSTRSQMLYLNVLEVPKRNRPAGYNNAIGDYRFDIAINPKSVKLGEPLTVTMKISGTGNIEELKIPDFPELPNFKSYEPESKVTITRDGVNEKGEKIFEKVLIPRKKGDFTIPQIKFSYFDPRNRVFKTLTKGPYTVKVSEGEDKEDEIKVYAINTNDKESEKGKIKFIKKDIHYIKTSLGDLRSSKKQVFMRPSTWVLCYILPVLVLVSFFGYRRHYEKLMTDKGFARKFFALKKISKYINLAEKKADIGDQKEFYDAVSKGLNNYIGDKLDKPIGTVSKNVINELKNYELDEGKLNDLKSLFERIELVLFCSVEISKEELKKDLIRFKNVIVELRRRIK